jgi:hypothetical protein
MIKTFSGRAGLTTIEYTSADELRYEANRLTQKTLGISAAEAWTRIQAGKYEGTILASQLKWMGSLLSSDGKEALCWDIQTRQRT